MRGRRATVAFYKGAISAIGYSQLGSVNSAAALNVHICQTKDPSSQPQLRPDHSQTVAENLELVKCVAKYQQA